MVFPLRYKSSTKNKKKQIKNDKNESKKDSLRSNKVLKILLKLSKYFPLSLSLLIRFSKYIFDILILLKSIDLIIKSSIIWEKMNQNRLL